MRISDWSSDVCSSDLDGCIRPAVNNSMLFRISDNIDRALLQLQSVRGDHDIRFDLFIELRREGVGKTRLHLLKHDGWWTVGREGNKQFGNGFNTASRCAHGDQLAIHIDRKSTRLNS